MITQQNFVKKNYPHALETQRKTGIPAIFILAQAALETGWGRSAPGNMFFGVKDSDGINGNEQLLTTTEYSKRNNLKFPVILGITEVIRNGQRWFKYRVRDYFRKYDTPEQSFTDHARLLSRNKRYAKAMKYTSEPYRFAEEIHKAGYATDPEYTKKLHSIMRIIERFI